MIGSGFAALGGAAAVAVLAHDHLADERMVSDFVYEAWLRRQSLQHLADRARVNPSRCDIVVLDHHPEPDRADHLTLKSLLAQSRRPDHIRLHLPERSRREGIAYDVPGWLKEIPSLRIVPCEDEGPATKLLPALTLPSHQKILVVDVIAYSSLTSSPPSMSGRKSSPTRRSDREAGTSPPTSPIDRPP